MYIYHSTRQQSTRNCGGWRGRCHRFAFTLLALHSLALHSHQNLGVLLACVRVHLGLPLQTVLVQWAIGVDVDLYTINNYV